MKFEKVKLKDLIFSTYNPRKKLTPKDDEYKKIKASINEFGYVDPIIVNSNNVIVGGFQRGQVLKELGYKEIDIVRIDISPEKEKALNIALNKIDCGYQIKAQIIWAKQHFALSRGNFNWQHEPCQPAGTIISTPSGQIPIEKLKDGDRVITYNSYSSSIIGKRKGFKIKTSKRFYNGDMFNIFVGNKNTKTTDNHKFTTRFSNDCDSKYGIYLMKKGEWWRIGITKLFNSRGFGLTVRLGNEKADAAWLLKICNKKNEAEVYEHMLSCKYGIPTTIWELARPRKGIPENLNWRSEEQIKWIYSMLDLDLMFLNVLKMLKDFNKRIEFPMVTKEETQYKPFGRNKTKLINACNLFEDIMCIPVPHNSGDSFDWIKISKIKISKFEDFVYSLDVDKYEHYIADGIVTHNCLYVVKNKKKHNWQGVNNASTIWNIKNNNSFGNSDKEQTYGHGTQKPIECMLKPINYNSCPGQAVYDPFLGSGTSLIASEQSGRICYGMEIDPIYCDVILQRYIDFVNNDSLFLIENNKKVNLRDIPKYKKIVGDGNAKK